jgi:hypothetical protein
MGQAEVGENILLPLVSLIGFFVLAFMLVPPFSLETFCLSQTAVHQVQIHLGHCDAFRRLLLQGVQSVHRCLSEGCRSVSDAGGVDLAQQV